MNRFSSAKLLRLLVRPAHRSPKDARRFIPAVECLEDRATPSAQAIGRDDWSDTDGSNAVKVAVLANDSPSQPGQANHPVTMKTNSVAIKTGPLHGKIKVNNQDGTVTYTATAGFTGTDSFTYTAKDTKGVLTNVTLVNIQVNRPTAADDWADTDGTNPVTISVLANDTDPDGNEHINYPGSVSRVSSPAHGTVTFNSATNEFTYTAFTNFMGTDSFRYVVTDDHGATSAPGTVLIQVNRPTAADDLASFAGTTPVVIDVLENDTDPDGNEHIVVSSVTITTPPQHGTATVDQSTGEVTYTANAGFNDTDKFQYTITDDAGATSAPGTVTVVGEIPAGVTDDFADTDGTNPVTVDVLANDVATGGMVPGSVRISRAPTSGTVSVNTSTGAITYTASTGFAGTDTFRYTARDAAGHSGSATVSIRVNRPVAADDWVDTDGTNAVTINVLENDTDPDGNEHILYAGSVTQVSSPAHGTVTFEAATNSFTYTAADSFEGTDSFQYIVTDDAGAASLPATVFIRVNRPVAADDFAIAHGTNPVTIAVLANDTDPDGNEHILYSGSVTQISSPSHGTVTFDAGSNSFTYTAAAGFSGTDSFQYVVTDDAGAVSMPATVRINVETPTMLGTTVAVVGSVTIDIAGLASHAEGDAALASFAVVTPPTHGHLVLDTVHWTIQYVPNAGFTGSDSFTVQVTDIYGVVSDVGTINLSVSGAV